MNTATTGILKVVGIGPGAPDLMAPRALAALQEAEVIIGYKGYLDQAAACIDLPELGAQPPVHTSGVLCRYVYAAQRFRCLEHADQGRNIQFFTAVELY